MGATLRKVLFWSHLAVGLAAGVTILIMCATGVLMTYERQIQSFVNRAGLHSRPATTSSQPLPIENLVTRVRAAKGIDPEYITVFSGHQQPVEVYLNPGTGSIYADAYTGAIIGAPSSATAVFFREVRAWHRWLAVRGTNRSRFRALIDASNLVFLFLTVFGLYLWMPRQWTWRHLRAVLLLRPGASGRARDFNWHNAIGFWSTIPLVVIIWTGVAMSYPWAKHLTYRAAGTPIQRRTEAESPSTDQPDVPESVPSDARFSGLDPLLDRAKHQAPGWKAIVLAIPDTPAEPVDFAIDMSGYGAVGKSADLELDRSGKVLSFNAAGSEGVSAKSFIRYGHTGELWGIPGQTVAGLASFGGLFLVWTGVSLSLRRLRSWRTRRAKRQSHGAATTRPQAKLTAKAA
jgi:uncharacterized iron-regulated membrane protein